MRRRPRRTHQGQTQSRGRRSPPVSMLHQHRRSPARCRHRFLLRPCSGHRPPRRPGQCHPSLVWIHHLRSRSGPWMGFHATLLNPSWSVTMSKQFPSKVAMTPPSSTASTARGHSTLVETTDQCLDRQSPRLTARPDSRLRCLRRDADAGRPPCDQGLGHDDRLCPAEDQVRQRHEAYLLGLTSTLDTEQLSWEPSFDLQLHKRLW